MPKFYSDPNKYKKIMEENITPTKSVKLSSWILIFLLFSAIVFIGFFSRSCTSRVIQTESRKLVNGAIIEIVGQNELYIGDYISYKVNLSSDDFYKINIKSFDTYIVYNGKKVFEYPSSNYPGPDTITTTVNKNKPKVIFSNNSFPYYPTNEGTYLIIADAYLNNKFVELRKTVSVLHKSPLALLSNSFFFPNQSLSGDVYLNNPYPQLKTFNVSDLKISINGEVRRKIFDESYSLTSGANAKICNLEDFYPPITINKTGAYALTLSSHINKHLETIRYSIEIIRSNLLSDYSGIDVGFNFNKYSYNINDNFWFDTYIVNNVQSVKYFKISSCSVVLKYKDTIIKSINIPIQRNLILQPFERFKLFSSKMIWGNLKVSNPYTIMVKVEFEGKSIKEITKKDTIKMQ